MYIRDSRTFMGGAALILAGAILTSMIQLYFEGEYSGDGVVRSRWWWEIVMNLQVLGVAFMWFCYVDRVSESVGLKKRIMKFRLLTGLCVILLPFWVALVSAYFNWFVVRPPIQVIQLLIVVMLVCWALIVLLPRIFVLKATPQKFSAASFLAAISPNSWWVLIPSYVVACLWVFELINGGTLHYQYTPLLLYFQGAVPYIEKSMRKNRLAPSHD